MLLLAAVQERLMQQVRPQNDLQRLWQNMFIGLQPLSLQNILSPNLDINTHNFITHPLYQVCFACISFLIVFVFN